MGGPLYGTVMLTKSRPTHYNTRYKFELSPRQREVLDLISRGRTNAQIADQLGITLDGAKWHVREILGKLNLDSREEAALYWHRYNSPMARLGRIASGFTIGGPTLKTALATLAVAGVVAVAAATVVVFNTTGSDDSSVGGEDTTVTPTPEPTEQPAAGESGGVAGFKDFAGALDSELRQGNIDAIIERLAAEPYTCTENDMGEGLGRPACDFAGQQFNGFLLSNWRSEGSLAPVERTEELLRSFMAAVLPGEQDQYGSGEARVYATAAGAEPYKLVITAIVERPEGFDPGDPIRVSLVIPWQYDGSQWQAVEVMVAYVLGEEFLEPNPESSALVPGWEKFN